jgi:lysozyme family protein
MTLQNNSEKWLDYVEHVLYYEGGLSKDPRDTASKCVGAGQYHTNKGVTFCTFKELAPSLGITPVTYEKFINLSNYEVGKFIYKFYERVQGPKFPQNIALLLTEIAWGSGPARAFTHLSNALKTFGIKESSLSDMINQSRKIDETKLFNAITNERKKYLDFLTTSPKYAQYKKGWNNRLNSFLSKFIPSIEGKKKMDNTYTLSDFFSVLFD